MSTMNDLQIVDFTKGIKSEQIQHNFQAIQEQVKVERSIVAGSGVIKGLNYNTNAPYDTIREGFPFTVSDGIFVDNQGNEIVFLSDTAYILSPTPTAEDVPLSSRIVRSDGTLSIKDNIPYASTGLTIAANDLDNNGLNLLDSNGNPVSPILGTPENPGIVTNIDTSETVIKLDAEKYAGRRIGGTYTIAQPHDELVYIGLDHKLHTVPSIDSSSPSIMDNVPEDCAYLLCAVGVETLPYARVVVKKDFKKPRNLYTDPDDKLYICGTKFDDLQIVHMVKPTAPIENTLWYDSSTNKLMVWSTNDGISGWKSVNDFSTHPVLNYKVWYPEITEFSNPGDLRILPEDLQTFMFDPVKEVDMLFIPGQNELQIIVDNSILMSDEFEEIVKVPGENDTSEFENYGIGFKLKNALSRPSYVEARTTHRVYDNPLSPRFQRTATFVSEGTIKCIADPVLGIPEYFETNVPYRYGEGQLEVFVEGKKLLPRIPDVEENTDWEFLEDSDVLNEPKVKGVHLKKFKISKSQFELLNGQRITYRITSSVYSYDDVYKVVETLEFSNEEAVNKANQAISATENLSQEMNDRLAEAATQIDLNRTDITSHIESHDLFYDKVNNQIKIESMPTEITSWIPSGVINQVILKTSDVIELADIKTKDFIMVLDVQANRLLIRDSNYSIDEIDGITYITLFPNAVINGHSLYITGIKLSAR